jgi:hypothetical protein
MPPKSSSSRTVISSTNEDVAKHTKEIDHNTVRREMLAFKYYAAHDNLNSEMRWAKIGAGSGNTLWDDDTKSEVVLVMPIKVLPDKSVYGALFTKLRHLTPFSYYMRPFGNYGQYMNSLTEAKYRLTGAAPDYPNLALDFQKGLEMLYPLQFKIGRSDDKRNMLKVNDKGKPYQIMFSTPVVERRVNETFISIKATFVEKIFRTCPRRNLP